eukprot:29660-Pelagococcus_subviridis.AAC.1
MRPSGPCFQKHGSSSIMEPIGVIHHGANRVIHHGANRVIHHGAHQVVVLLAGRRRVHRGDGRGNLGGGNLGGRCTIRGRRTRGARGTPAELALERRRVVHLFGFVRRRAILPADFAPALALVPLATQHGGAARLRVELVVALADGLAPHRAGVLVRPGAAALLEAVVGSMRDVRGGEDVRPRVPRGCRVLAELEARGLADLARPVLARRRGHQKVARFLALHLLVVVLPRLGGALGEEELADGGRVFRAERRRGRSRRGEDGFPGERDDRGGRERAGDRDVAPRGRLRSRARVARVEERDALAGIGHLGA